MIFNVFFATVMAVGAISSTSSLEGLSTWHHGGDLSDHEEYSPKEIGKKLVNEFWRDVKYQRVKAYSNLIAHDFKGLNEGGHYDREDQIAGLEGLTVTEFDIRRLTAARYGKTLVISYNFVAEGTGITSGPSIDVWREINNEWFIVSHSYVPFVQET